MSEPHCGTGETRVLIQEQSPSLLAEREVKLAALGPRPPWWRSFARRRWDRRTAEIMATDVSQRAEMASRPPKAADRRRAREIARAIRRATR